MFIAWCLVDDTIQYNSLDRSETITTEKKVSFTMKNALKAATYATEINDQMELILQYNDIE